MRSCSRSVAGVWAAGLFGLRTGRLAFDDVWKRPMSPQPPSVSAAHRAAAAQMRLDLCRVRWPVASCTPLFSLIPQNTGRRRQIVLQDPTGGRNQLDLSRVRCLDPGTAAPLDPAPNPDPFAFQRLKVNPGRFE